MQDGLRCEYELVSMIQRCDDVMPENCGHHDFLLSHGKLLTDAVPWSGREWQKSVRMPSFGFFWQKPFWIEDIRIGEVRGVLVEHLTKNDARASTWHGVFPNVYVLF